MRRIDEAETRLKISAKTSDRVDRFGEKMNLFPASCLTFILLSLGFSEKKLQAGILIRIRFNMSRKFVNRVRPSPILLYFSVCGLRNLDWF